MTISSVGLIESHDRQTVLAATIIDSNRRGEVAGPEPVKLAGNILRIRETGKFLHPIKVLGRHLEEGQALWPDKSTYRIIQFGQAFERRFLVADGDFDLNSRAGAGITVNIPAPVG